MPAALLGVLVALLVSAQNETSSCVAPGTCTPPPRRFTKVLPIKPRQQWNIDGGFCGSLSLQVLCMGHGMYVSQDLVRKANIGAPCHGHGKGQPGAGNGPNGCEVGPENYAQTAQGLSVTYDVWNYAAHDPPQATAWKRWAKGHLAKNEPVMWAPICKGDSHTPYGPASCPGGGHFDHHEPFIGVGSNHSLDEASASEVYDEDYILMFSAQDQEPYYRLFSTLEDTVAMEGNCKHAGSGFGKNEMYPCFDSHVTYGMSITGLSVGANDVAAAGVRVTVDVNSGVEPNVREPGVEPAMYNATVTVTGLVKGTKYALKRFAGLPKAGAVPVSVFPFTPTGASWVYGDPMTVKSSSAAYWRVGELAGISATTAPANPMNLTVYALRPLRLSSLVDKDSADIAGDLFFWIKDRILHPMHCRRAPSWNQCNTSDILQTGDQVYAEYVITVDAKQIGNYASCNPVPGDPSGATWVCRPTESSFGIANISRFGRPGGQFPGDVYSGELAKTLTPGQWYSTQRGGECNGGSGGTCAWQVAERGKMVNATCLNANVVAAITNAPAAATCLSRCEGGGAAACIASYDTRNITDCCIECFFAGVTAIGRDPIVKAYAESFGEGATGCPPVVAPLVFAAGSTPIPAPPAVTFSAGFASDMVLQRDTGAAGVKVYGLVRFPAATIALNIVVTSSSGKQYTPAVVVISNGTATGAVWSTTLNAAPASSDVFSIAISCTKGCTENATLDNAVIDRVVYGDTYFCSGQSNMALSSTFTYSSEALTKDILSSPASYEHIRIFQYGGMSVSSEFQSNAPRYATNIGAENWYNLSAAAAIPEPAKGKHVQYNPFHEFAATCLYFGIELDAQNKRDAATSDGITIPIGLIQSAVGGTMIEAWLDNATLATCSNTSGYKYNTSTSPPTFIGYKLTSKLYYGMVTPFVNMSVNGWVWYQGENNCGGDPGNSARHEGYGCMQVALVSLWREQWSKASGGTAPDAPFGVVSLAAGGSEGHTQKMASLRWSQTGNYGVLPNPLMPNTFLAHAYDIGDPWAKAETGLSGGNNPTPNCSRGYPNLDPLSPDCVPWDDSNWNAAVKPMAPLVKNSSATHWFMVCSQLFVFIFFVFLLSHS